MPESEVIGLPSGKRRILIGLAALGAVVYLVLAAKVDIDRLSEALRTLGYAGSTVILLLSLLNYGIRFGRWHMYLAQLGRTLPIWRNFLYYLSGFAFTVSPGKVGEAVRSVYLRSDGVTYSESIAALFVERLLDLLAIILLASLIVMEHTRFRPLVIGALAAVGTVIALASQSALPDALESFARRMPANWLTRSVAGLATLIRASRRLLKLRLLLIGGALGVIAWGAEGFGFFIICTGLHLAIKIPTAIGLYSISVLAGSAAFFLPAGIGGTELAMTALLIEHGVLLRSALLATLLCRLATLWFAVLLGVVAATTIELYGRYSRFGIRHE